MSDRATIERAMRVVDPPELTLERFHTRRDRKRRTQRAVTALFALALFGALAVLAGRAVFLDRSTPADDTPPSSPGIVVPTGALLDPAGGRSIGSLPIPGATDLSWSPDGASLAYAAASGVFVLDTETAEARQVYPCGLGHHIGCTIAWSPDGRVIAVARGNALVLVDVGDGHRTPVRTFPLGKVVLDPSWAPDGDRIAFTLSVGYGYSRDLYTVGRDGSDLARIVDRTSNGIGVWSPSWSPDGSRIAYIDSQPWGHGRWKLRVVTVDPDGTHPDALMDAGRCYCLGLVPALGWSPDGTRLALVIPPPGNEPGKRSDLYVADADGTHLELVARGIGGPPAWRPAVRNFSSSEP